MKIKIKVFDPKYMCFHICFSLPDKRVEKLQCMYPHLGKVETSKAIQSIEHYSFILMIEQDIM